MRSCFMKMQENITVNNCKNYRVIGFEIDHELIFDVQTLFLSRLCLCKKVLKSTYKKTHSRLTKMERKD